MSVISGGISLSYKLLIKKIGHLALSIIENEFQELLFMIEINNENIFRIGLILIITSLVEVNVFCKIIPEILNLIYYLVAA